MGTETDAPMLALIDVPGEVAPTVRDQALVVLTDAEAFDQFYARMKAETDKHDADVSTDKGRKAVIALARRVTTTKTAITAAAKGLTEGWREQTAKVNAARRPIEERLAALAEEVRRPVTEWEAAEAERAERNRAVVREVMDAGIVREDDTAASVEQRGREVHDRQFGPDGWTDAEIDAAVRAKGQTVAALVAARNRLRQEEANRAELEKLRAEADARAAKDAEEARLREEAEAAERMRREAEEREIRRIAEEERERQREADRIAKAAEEAAAKAKRDAEEAAAREQRERDAAAAKAIADAQAERDRIAKAAQDAEDERQRAAKAEADERARIAAEDAARAANRAHVAKVMGAAKEAIMTCGVTEDQARAIVTAIKGDLIPAVRIAF